LSVNILKAVLHILDKDASEPLLNEFELEINEDLHTFLEKHISRALADDDARKACFREGKNIVREVGQRMALDGDYFLEGSWEIARQMFRSMKTNNNISSTDLVICVYEGETGNSTAVLKMDYTTSFLHDIQKVEDKFRITIARNETSLPGINQKIQKCAFIRGGFSSSGYDLIVLDNQIHKNTDEPVAQFFLENFLDAELINDSKSYTQLFKKETENWIRSKVKEGEPFAENLREHVNSVIRQEEEIVIQDLSQKVFENKTYLQEDYVQSMRDKGLTGEKFSVDRDWVDRKLARVRLKTETGIEINLGYEVYNDREKFEILSNPDGTRTIVIKCVGSLMEK
jgi:hypothetical protein